MTRFSRAGLEVGRVLSAMAELGYRRGWRSLEPVRSGGRRRPKVVWTAR